MVQPEGTFKWRVSEGEVPSTAVVSAISTVCNCDPMELPPLSTAIDPDALDGLVTSADAQDRNRLSVTFDYNGCQVIVTGHGLIQVTTSDSAT